MLPDTNTDPAGFCQSFIGVAVAGTVRGDLVRPKPGVRRRDRVMIGAAVPEAPVQEDCDPSGGEDQVSGPPKARQGSAGHSVAQAEGVHRRPEREFRLGVASTIGLHARTRAGRGCP